MQLLQTRQPYQRHLFQAPWISSKEEKKAKPAYNSNQNFRQLPKAIQVSTESKHDSFAKSYTNIQLDNLQNQVNWMSHMMSIMFANKGLKSSEDQATSIVTVFSFTQSNIASSS